MRNAYILLAVVSMLLLLSACELERVNSLDPRNSNTAVPQQVTNIEITNSVPGADDKWVELTWSVTQSAAKYYVYRALSYSGSYQNLVPDGILNPTGGTTVLYRDTNVFSGNDYYYKISAVNEDGLEGSYSPPQYARIQ